MFIHILNYCCKQDALKILAYKTIKFLILKHMRVYMCVEKGTSHQKRELPMQQRFWNTPTWEQSTSQLRCCVAGCPELGRPPAPTRDCSTSWPSSWGGAQYLSCSFTGISVLPQRRASMKYSTAVRRGIMSITDSDGELTADFSNSSPFSFPAYLQFFLL